MWKGDAENMHKIAALTSKVPHSSEEFKFWKLWKTLEERKIDPTEIRTRVSQIQWFHNYELVPGVMTNGSSPMLERAPYFQIPQDLRGKRVLDIGCADGYFTFLAESRGASVVAIDSWPRQGFFLAHEVLGSKAEFHHMNIYDLGPDTLGMFDIVFFFGVYYHLKNPILALERIASMTREYAIIESEIMNLAKFQQVWNGYRQTPTPGGRQGLWDLVRRRVRAKNKGLMPGSDGMRVLLERLDAPGISRFYEHDELANDPTNWWVPSVSCLVQTIRAAGFPRAELVACYEPSRGIVRAHKGPRTAGKILTEDLFIVIDSPTANLQVRGTVLISGWALSQLEPKGGIEHVRVYLDNLDDPTSELGEAEYGSWRADLTTHFGEKYGASGFQFTWNTVGVTRGRHTLHVLVEGKRGWHYRSVPITIKQ